MSQKIENVAVIGAGVMGSSIAAHLANCGLNVVLFDIIPPTLTKEDEENNLTKDSYEFRYKFALRGMEHICDKKNPLLYDKNFKSLITIANLDDDLDKIKECDLIVEVVLEEVKVKQDLFKKIENYIKPNAIIGTNTSGLSINEISSSLLPDQEERFLGIHFFNPVRFMHLLEVIPTDKTSSQVIETIKSFGEDVLGKGVVLAKDTPNFIGNRIGVYAQCLTFKIAQKYNFNFSQIDQFTGPLLMRPKSASFRTVDLVGLDILAHTAQTCLDKLDPKSEDISVFELPSFVQKMLENKQLGNKTRGGFYKRTKIDGKTAFLMWDPKENEYIPVDKTELAGVTAAKKETAKMKRLKAMVDGGLDENKFAWEITRDILLYCANCIPQITEDFKNIDKAMKWGYNWEMGPFEIWDALGEEYIAKRIKEDGLDIPKWVEDYLKDNGKFYKEKEEKNLYEIYPTIQKVDKEVVSVDLGDGIVCIEFISKSNCISLNVLNFIIKTIQDVEQSEKYRGIVIGNKGKNFSSGVDLTLVDKLVQEGDYDKLRALIDTFQKTSHAVKYSKVPVVAAIFNMTMGGGHEIALHCHKTVAHQETYRGFAEVGVGIIPGGGGFLEMLKRSQEELAKYNFADLSARDRLVWEIIATAKFSKNAYDMKNLLFYKESDIIIANKEKLIDVAKKEILKMLDNGFRSNLPQKIKVTGVSGRATLEYIAQAMLDGNFISEHDFEIAKQVAKVVTGGDVPKGTYLDEKTILSLELEALFELVKTKKTQERIKFMIEKNKPLRN